MMCGTQNLPAAGQGSDDERASTCPPPEPPVVVPQWENVPTGDLL